MTAVMRFEAALDDAGWLDGTAVKVRIDLPELLKGLTPKMLADELEQRAQDEDEDAVALVEAIADTWGDDEPPVYDVDADPVVERLSDWDRENLIRAVEQDDGRRAIDILKANFA